MTERSYNQYCPIAHALDLVGQRWTLLIIRNLFLGPKRFSDLLRGLPGIGTNILTTRLKALDEAGLIHSRFLPPPAASAVYELTDAARGLEPVMMALMQWGMPTMGAPAPEQVYSSESVGLMLYTMFRLAAAGGGLAGTYAVQIEGEPFQADYTVGVRGQTVTVEPQAPADYRLRVRTSLATLGALAGRGLAPRAAYASGQLVLEGSAAEAEAFLAQVESVA